MSKIIQTFTDFGNRVWRDRLEGGRGDKMKPEDFDSDDISIGSSVEREHSSNPDIATEIAIDHLTDDNEYYYKLITAGLVDEEEPINLFDKLKGKNYRDKAEKDIKDYMEEDDYDDEDYDEDDDEYEEDDLGTDKDLDDEDDLILDEEEPKNKRQIMEKSIKNYKSFLKESADVPAEQVSDPGPERKFTKENKYKFQLPYDKKVVDKLMEFNFVYYVPDGEKDVTKPTKDTHNIIIDILNLNYAIVDNDYPDIRQIDSSRLKHILDNL